MCFDGVLLVFGCFFPCFSQTLECFESSFGASVFCLTLFGAASEKAGP